MSTKTRLKAAARKTTKCGCDRDPLGTPDEVAAFLKIQVQTLYWWRYRGEGPPSIKVGRALRYRWAAVDTWLETGQPAA